MLDSERYRAHANDCLKVAANASLDSWSRRMHLSMCGVWLTLAIEDEKMNAMVANWGADSGEASTNVIAFGCDA